MTSQQSVVERAYILAGDGHSRDMGELVKRLRTEGFTHGDLTQLQFPQIGKSLRRVIRDSRDDARRRADGERGAGPVPAQPCQPA